MTRLFREWNSIHRLGALFLFHLDLNDGLWNAIIKVGLCGIAPAPKRVVLVIVVPKPAAPVSGRREPRRSIS